jgi:hypothetical protein
VAASSRSALLFAVQDGHPAAGDRPLEVVLEEVVGLGLSLAELHGVGELGLGRLVAALPPHPRHHHRGRQQPGKGQHQFLTDS